MIGIFSLEGSFVGGLSSAVKDSDVNKVYNKKNKTFFI